MTKVIVGIAFMFAVIGFVIGIFSLCAWLLQLAWNVSISEIFEIKDITFLQALGLVVVAGILTGGIRAVKTN